jgi:hypothetical protein
MTPSRRRTVKLEDEVIKAALHWWKMRRPLNYSLNQHLENPMVNACNTPASARLAKAVGRYRAASRKGKSNDGT